MLAGPKRTPMRSVATRYCDNSLEHSLGGASFRRHLAGRVFGPVARAGARFFKNTRRCCRKPNSAQTFIAPGCKYSPDPLALAELEALAGALLAVLLAFAHARIAGQETIFAQAGTQLRVKNRERAGQSHAHRARLAADAATIHGGHHVHLILGAGKF